MSNVSEPSVGTSRLAASFWGALLLTTLPLSIAYFVQLWDLPHYQYFPALLLALCALVWVRWNKAWELPTSRWAWLLVVASLVALLLGSAYWSPWLGCVGLILALGAFLLSHHESVTHRWGLFHLWPCSWMLLRLPLNLDAQLTGWLQMATAKVSSGLLDLIGVVHQLSGNVFHLPKGSLFVEAACSGVQSLFSLLFCAVLLVAWNRRSPILLPFYALTAVLWAGIMNIVRVVVIALAQERLDLDLAHGWQHEVLGFACLGIAIVLLLSVDRLMKVLFFPMPSELSDNIPNPILVFWNRTFFRMHGPAPESVQSSQRGSRKVARAGAPSRWLPRLAMASIASFVCLVLIPQVVLAVRHYSAVSLPSRVDFWVPDEGILTDAVPGLKVVDYQVYKDGSNPTLGVHAHMWVCNLNGLLTRVVVSQHSEIHDLCICYSANGWQLNGRKLSKSKTAGDAPWEFVEASFVNSDTVFGSLFFSTLDKQGSPVSQKGWSFTDLMQQRTQDPDDPNQRSFHGESVNIQAWTTSETPFTPTELDVLRELHSHVREIIRRDLAVTKTPSKD